MNLKMKLLCGIAALLTGVLVAQAQVPGVNSTLNSVFTLVYDQSTMKPTYSATATSVAAVASQTDMCSLQGSATKTIKVRRIAFGNVPTTAYSEVVAVVKRSTANSGAGSALATAAYDTSNAATSVAQAEIWTAAPTLGTIIGVLADVTIPFGISTSSSAPYYFEWGQRGQPIVLRGVAQSVAINLNTVTLTGTVSCLFEWTEE